MSTFVGEIVHACVFLHPRPLNQIREEEAIASLVFQKETGEVERNEAMQEELA